jgi:CRP-like cAMP-binding protein
VTDRLSKLSSELVRAFADAPPRTYPSGVPIYSRGAPARGVFLVQAGQVRLNFGTSRAPAFFYLAGPGSIVGLGETMSGTQYDATAEPVHAATLSFLGREDLLSYLREHCDTCLQLVQLLSEDLHQLYQQYRRAGRSGRRSPNRPKSAKPAKPSPPSERP